MTARKPTYQVDFDDMPTLGSVIEFDGLPFHVVGHQDHVRRDGTASALIIWNMNCVDCGERVEIKTGMKAKGITKRCAAHRKKGKPATEAAMARMTAGRPCHRENEKR